MRLAVSMALLSMALLACGEDHWLATVYPDQSNLGTFLDFGEYSSLPKCRRAAKMFLAYIGRTDAGSYECGKNCKPLNPDDPGPDPLMICKATEK